MTTAEKLAIVAENMQRVYDAGYAKGKADAGGGSITLITFTIDGTEYQAEEGMTWGEWCESAYNTIGAYIDGNNGGVYDSADDAIVDVTDGGRGHSIAGRDEIVENGKYEIS